MEKRELPLLLSFKQLREIGIIYSREHLWRLEREGRFPRRVRLSPQKIAWFEDEVRAFLKLRADERSKRVYPEHD